MAKTLCDPGSRAPISYNRNKGCALFILVTIWIEGRSAWDPATCMPEAICSTIKKPHLPAAVLWAELGTGHRPGRRSVNTSHVHPRPPHSVQDRLSVSRTAPSAQRRTQGGEGTRTRTPPPHTHTNSGALLRRPKNASKGFCIPDVTDGCLT